MIFTYNCYYNYFLSNIFPFTAYIHYSLNRGWGVVELESKSHSMIAMIIFIDESGDSGFKIKKGSSKIFAIALVIFDDELEAEATALNIKRLRRRLNRSDRYEFKFNKASKKERIEFLKVVQNCKFRIRAIVIEKEKIYSPNLRNYKDRFYNYVIKMVLKHNNKTIRNAKIKLDGSGDRTFRRNLRVYLSRELGKDKVMKNFKFSKSHSNVLIQLSDMIVGSLRRSYLYQKSDH